jgi:hypothetical protein
LLIDINSSASNALTRRVLNDFPGRNWTDEVSDFIDTRSISQRGGKATLRFALDISEKPIVLDWRWPLDDNLLAQFASDSRCRVVICESSDIGLPFILTSAGGNGKFDLEMPGRLHLPIRVESEVSVPSDWKPPRTPNELSRGDAVKVSNASNELEAIWQATRLRDGDEAWADRHEKAFPLASWIATPKSGQVARWRRIGDSIRPVWANLADLESFDEIALCNLALVDDDALSILINRIRSNPLNILSADTSHPAIATAILLSEEWIEESIDVTDAWLSQPLRLGEVLLKNWSRNNIATLVTACPQHQLLLENKTLDREEILAVMEDVHYSLWAEQSASWLATCMASLPGRTALSLLDLPWPAILFQQDLASEDLVLVHHMPDGVGTDGIMDVLEGISAAEEGRPPPQGRTHPYAGWLFQNRVPMIPIPCESNLDVHLALHRRLQQ